MFSTLKHSFPSCGISQTEASKFDKVLSLENSAGTYVTVEKFNKTVGEISNLTTEDKLSLVSCNYDIGDEVGIYYDVDNPANRVVIKQFNNLFIILYMCSVKRA